jgi:putative ABC transport system substrate-binding protein
MRRREFLGLTGTAALSLARPGQAQTKADLPVVGVLIHGREELAKLRLPALRLGLQQAGLVEGKNYSLAIRLANGDLSLLPSLAKELGDLKPAVVVVASFPATTHKAIPDVPLVFTGFAADPVAQGLVESWTRPGGLITGNVMNAVGGEETFAQKRLGLFKDLVPRLTRLGMVAPDPGRGLAVTEKTALQKVSTQFGFEFKHYGLASIDDLEAAFASARGDDVDAFFISGEPLMISNISHVMPFITASGKPSFGPYEELARAGLLMSYSSDLNDGFRQAGIYAAKILGGAKPGDLPIEQASKFVFAINLRTAKALGITVPANLMTLADVVIE